MNFLLLLAILSTPPGGPQENHQMTTMYRDVDLDRMQSSNLRDRELFGIKDATPGKHASDVEKDAVWMGRWVKWLNLQQSMGTVNETIRRLSMLVGTQRQNQKRGLRLNDAGVARPGIYQEAVERIINTMEPLQTCLPWFIGKTPKEGSIQAELAETDSPSQQIRTLKAYIKARKKDGRYASREHQLKVRWAAHKDGSDAAYVPASLECWTVEHSFLRVKADQIAGSDGSLMWGKSFGALEEEYGFKLESPWLVEEDYKAADGSIQQRCTRYERATFDHITTVMWETTAEAAAAATAYLITQQEESCADGTGIDDQEGLNMSTDEALDHSQDELSSEEPPEGYHDFIENA